MPWNPQQPLAEQRADFLARLEGRTCTFAQACQHFNISRKTGYKWHGRATCEQPQPLRDRSRRPHTCPQQTAAEIERAILEVHDSYGWGARKIHSFLTRSRADLPSWRTVHEVLRRHRRAGAAAPAVPAVRFQRDLPNQLWQMDFKGPLARAPHQRYTLTIEDDHSRYLLAVELLPDQTMASVWRVLWPLFGAVGLPEAFLSDNGFAPRGPAEHGLSWLEARLLRLGIKSLHGRPYHPQTQGKVERAHQTMERELLPRLDWSKGDAQVAAQLEHWRTAVYNAIRPHEALGNAVPASRWYASEQPRPARLPALVYPKGAETRKVMQRGEISWRGYELLVGAGLQGERVAVQLRQTQLVLNYGTHELRRLELSELRKGRIC